MRSHMKGFIGVLILSVVLLDGCRGSSSSSTHGACAGSTCQMISVAWGAGVFVAVGSGGPLRGNDEGNPWIEVSTDGIDWMPADIHYTPAQLDQAYILRSIAYGKEGFVTTDGVHVLHSADGRNWTMGSFQSAAFKIAYVIYDGTRYILYSNTVGPYGYGEGVGDNIPWKVSTDGVNWTDYGAITVTNGPAGEPVSIIHEAGEYEAAWQAAQSVTDSTRYLTATSPDGLSWTLGTPVPVTNMSVRPGLPVLSVAPVMYGILHTGGQYLLFGGRDEFPVKDVSWGVALHGSSMSAMTVVGPLQAENHGNGFRPAGEPLYGNPYETHALVSNGTATVGLGEGGLFVTTDGITWTYRSPEGVVPETGCAFAYPGTPTCTAFASGAAAPGGSIVVLVSDGNAGAVTTDGIHWVTSNL